MSIFIDTLKAKKCNRPPVWFMRQAGRVLPSYLKLRENYSFSELMLNPELAAKVTLLPVYDLGVDAAILFSDILVVPQALGLKVNFTDKGPVFQNPLKDIENPMTVLKPDLAFFDYIYKTLDIISKTKPNDTPLIGFCGSPFTVICYMIQGLSSNHEFPDATKFVFEKIDETKKIIDLITEVSINYALNQIKHGIDAFQLFETHAGLIPFSFYQKYFLPAVKKIGDAVREKNIPFIFFPRGIGNGIKNMDFSIADVISVDWQNDITIVRGMLDKKIGLQGNLDPRFLIYNQKTLLNELENFRKFGKNENYWIFNLGHGVLPSTKFENAKFVVDWIKSTNWNR